MKSINATNINQFFSAVNKCEGRVELVTKYGDRLDLKATLSQYVSMVKLLTEDSLSDIEVIIHNDGDAKKLRGYSFKYKKGL